MRILVDMDGVLADFEQGFVDVFSVRYPEIPYLTKDQRTEFYLKELYPPEVQPLVTQTYSEAGFFLNLPVIYGARQGLEALKNAGADVFICTSPLLKNPTCASDKFAWMEKHFGKVWRDRVIVTKDKTLVHSDILIDDRPEIEGCMTPTWEHVLFSQKYNEHVSGKRRLTWSDAMRILGL